MDEIVKVFSCGSIHIYKILCSDQFPFFVTVQVLPQSAPGVAATLDAVWTVRRTKGAESRSGRTTLSEPVPDRGYAALAAAHSRALGRLSGEVAGAIRALESGGP